MSSSRPRTALARPDTAAWAPFSVGAIGGAVVALIALAASLLPYRSVFAGNDWLMIAALTGGSTILAAALVMAIGELAQQRRFSARRGVVVGVLAQLAGFVAGLVTLSTQFARPIPNPALPWRVRARTITDFYATLTSDGMTAAYEGHPPVVTTPGILWLMGLLTLMLSLVYLTTIVLVRTPVIALVVALLAASVPLILIGINNASVVWIVSAAALAGALLTTRVRALDQQAPRRPATIPGSLAGVGVSLLAATLVAVFVTSTVTMPRPTLSFLPGKTVGLTLSLGEDLRVPVPRPVFEVRTTGAAPYLRIGTLTALADGTWLPDPVDDQPATGVPAWMDTETPRSRPVEITPLAAAQSYAPVPYPIAAFAGLNSDWYVLSQNLTLRNEGAPLGNAPYSALQLLIEPTRDEMVAAVAAPPQFETPNLSLDLDQPPGIISIVENGVERSVEPGDPGYDEIARRFGSGIPERFRALAQEITEEASSDVEKAQSIERYLRTNFRYSLATPVEQGFDGSDIAATEQFLDVGAGYCVHFASAFTLMARSAGLPTRIVVGYLPGTLTGTDGDMRTYQVFSDQAHSWPEVHFEGIGWVAFEPTATIGGPTTFTNPTDAASEPTPTPTASATPTATPSPTPTPTQSIAPAPGNGGSAFLGVLHTIAQVLGWVLLALLVLALPALWRRARRHQRTRLMTSADAHAAADASWQEVRDTLVDAGLPAPDGETIRQFGTRMRSSGVSAELVAEYTATLEAAAYRPAGDAGELASLTRQVHAAIIATTSRGARRRAVFAPRSLLRGSPRNRPSAEH